VARVGQRFGVPSGQSTGAGPARALLIYNLARGGLLLICLGIGWLAGLRGLLLIVVALLVSGLLSWFVLTRQRVNMGMAIERTVGRSRERMAARTAAEDAYADELERSSADEQRPS
jgi:hypothetical protein